MPWVAAAATVAGAVISSEASKKAAKTQASAADRASQVQQDAAAQTRQDLNPWRYAGGNALSKMQQMTGTSDAAMGITPSLYSIEGDNVVANRQLYASDPAYRKAWDGDVAAHQAKFGKAYTMEGGSNVDNIQSSIASQLGADHFAAGGAGAAQPYNFVNDDPGARYRLQQAEQGTNRAMAARGMGNSGNVLQELSRVNSDMASQEFGNSFNRLAGMSQGGQMAANQTSSFGNAAAGQIGQNTIGAGNAQAAGQIGQANAWTSAAGQGMDWWQQKQKQDQQQQVQAQMY